MTNKLHNHKSGSYEGIYSLHKYWSKKPPNIIKNLIEKNSKEGDLIIDPFLGSGISVIESVVCNRRAIGVDINPASVFITRQLLSLINIELLNVEYKRIEDFAKPIINELYEIKRNNTSHIASHFIWKDKVLDEVWFKNGKPKYEKTKAQKDDIIKAKSFTYEGIKQRFPKNKMFENSRINVKKNDKVHQLFTPRNLYALSILFNEIEQVKDDKVRDILKFCFTSSMGQASKMVFVINKKIDKNNGEKTKLKNKSVGSWVIGYWQPKEHFEINVWNCFERKYEKILKAKSNQLQDFPFTEESNSFSNLLNKKSGFHLSNQPAQKFLINIQDNSVDYIITDPPHGDRIPYLELSQLWNSWLGNKVNFEDELIVSGSKERQKDQASYNNLLNDTFREIYRILKPGKKFTLMFNSLDDETWINIINSLNEIGFKLKNIETLSYSANSVVQDNREIGLKTDFVLTYEKATTPLNNIYLLNGVKGEATLGKLIGNVKEKKEGIEKYEILNELFFKLLKKNQFFKLSQAIKLINNLN
ncbi:DNA methyltransferase [Allomuricauda sp. R78024]|uniref:DNA methyltransferase n=1 Tax=Allomuricauda sp. R78024 TaxID=3093867 RepID=UPI0037C63ED6